LLTTIKKRVVIKKAFFDIGGGGRGGGFPPIDTTDWTKPITDRFFESFYWFNE